MSWQNKCVWAIPLSRLAGEVFQGSPQQARLATLRANIPGGWSPRLRVTITGNLNTDRLRDAVIRTINASPALRCYVFAASSVVTAPTLPLTLADVLPDLEDKDDCFITLSRTNSAASYELLMELPPGSVDSNGLLQALEGVVCRYHGRDTAATAITPRDIAEYLNDLIRDSDDSIGFWSFNLARTTVRPQAGALGQGEPPERRMAWEAVANVDPSRWFFQDLAGQRATLACLWRLLLSEVAPEERGFGLYCPGANVELPGSIGLLGRYVPAETGDLSLGQRSSLVSQAADRILELDAMADFYPCHAISGRVHRFGFRFASSDQDLRLGAATFRIDELIAPLEPFDMELVALSLGAGLQLSLHYNEAVFDAEDARGVACAMSRLVSDWAESPQEIIDPVSLTDPGRLTILRGEPVDAGNPDDDVFSIFEGHAHRTPDQTAAADQLSALSYAELLAAAERIDRSLMEWGVGPGDGVAIGLTLRPGLIAALLGVMRRRAFFVPLDVNQPLCRIQTIVRESAPKLVLCDRETSPILGEELETTVLCVEDLLAWSYEPPLQRPSPRNRSDPAYLLHTSGSTGVPKGVEVGYASLMNYLKWAAHRYEIERGSGAVVHSSIAFDMTVTSLFVPLVGGRTVHLVPADDFEGLARFLERTERLSFLKLTPSALSLLGELMPSGQIARSTRHIVLGGEQLLARSLWCVSGATDLLITNEYGPTETTVGSIAYTFKASDAVPDPVPIGSPLWNTQIAIVRSPERFAMMGRAGEIVIGGTGVAIGYRNQAKETAERFRSLPTAGEGAWYYTGDLGVLRDDGLLVYRGRADDQVKIQGYRVETGEVASVLARCPGIASAEVVAARHRATGKTFLSAFVRLADASGISDLVQIHAWARAHLPSYARPDRLEVLDEFPLARSGKVDRKALVARSAAPVASAVTPLQGSAAPDAVLSSVWTQILGRPPSRSDDNFFAMGGDSIKALHLVAAAKDRGVRLTIADILNGRTFDQIVKAAKAMYSSQAEVVRARGEIPLLPTQRAYLDLDRANQDSWYLAWIFSAADAVDPTRLAAAAAAVRDRHSALRASFSFESARWHMNVKQSVDIEPPEIIDIMDSDDRMTAEQLAERLARVGQLLNLNRGITAKLCRIDLGPSRGLYLAWVAHHLVADIVSLQIMSRELLASYHQPGKPLDDDDGYVEWATNMDSANSFQFPVASRAVRCQQLLGTIGNEMGAKIMEPDVAKYRRGATLIQTALMRSVVQMDGLSDVARICVERQGRTNSDLVSAVGWLTAYQVFDLSDARALSRTELIERIHLRLVSDVIQPTSGMLPEVALNFLGDLPESGEYLPRQLSLVEGRSDAATLLFPLEIVVWIKGKKLESSWRFDEGRYCRDLVRRLMDLLQLELLDVLAAGEDLGPIPADFPDAALSNADLARILANFQ